MGKYRVKLAETLYYELDIEADSLEEAEEKALEHPEYLNSEHGDQDTTVEESYELEGDE